MMFGEWYIKMDERDKKVLGQISTVNMDKIPNTGDKEAEREDDIKSAMEYLEDFIDPWRAVKLNDWEKEFIDSIEGFIARGYRLTDKQFEKLLQIKVKYE